MQPKLVIYMEVAPDLADQPPVIAVLRMSAENACPPGFRLGQEHFIGDSDGMPPMKVVGWDVLDVRTLA